MQRVSSLVPTTPNTVARPVTTETDPAKRWPALNLAWPGVGLWRQGMHKKAGLLAVGTGAAVTGAVLAPWASWDGVVVSLVCFRAVLGLWVAGAADVKQGLVGFGLWPELAAVKAFGLRGARGLVSVGLLLAMTLGLGAARWSTRRTVEATSVTMAQNGKSHVINDVEPHRMALVMPRGWSLLQRTPQWPTVVEMARDDGACRARVFLVAAPPLPDALEGFYVSRMLQHHLGEHVVEAQDAMFVSMWPTRQFAYARDAQHGVLTAVERGSTWNVLQMDALGDVGMCAMDFTTLRSSWSLP